MSAALARDVAARSTMRPLVVVEGDATAVADALADLRAEGWEVVSGWRAARPGVVCTGVVASAEDAAAALLASIGGAGLVVHGRAPREILDRLCDDLRRIGHLDHRTASTPRAPRLTAEERALVDLLLEGMTLGEAAKRLNLARRTADRRLASLKQKLGVATTAEALVAAGRRRS
jgi:DNA-binding CsgD family transcriptional regulator